MLSEFNSFPIDPCVGTFENCLANVDECADMFILIVGNRYGYVLENGKSITNLEYLHAKAKGIPIYVFVSKEVNNTRPIWKANKGGDFSGVVDNPAIFQFVSDIYDECRQWIYTYESVQDIKITMKNQLGLIFGEGLRFKALLSEPKKAVLNCGIPAEAARMVIEEPYAWEYKFLAYVLKDEFDKLQQRKWDLEYGYIDGPVSSKVAGAFLDSISAKCEEMITIAEMLSTMLNTVIHDAIGEPGTPSNLDMMCYTAKRLAALYERLISWSLYFKSLKAEPMFDRLITLLCDLPISVLKQVDEFIERYITAVLEIPDVDDGINRHIQINMTLESDSINEVTAEIQKLNNLL